MNILVNGARMHVKIRGADGIPVVLLHGLGGTHSAWSGIQENLAGSQRVICPDLRGCGASERGDAGYTLRTLALDCLGILDALVVPKCHVIGHSLGGVVAQELLTSATDRFVSAVLVSTSSRVGDSAAAAWSRLAETVEKRGLGNQEVGVARGFSESFAKSHPELLRTHAALAMACDPSVYASQARAAAAYDYTERLAAVSIPVLVVQGLADSLTSPGGSVLLARALPRATLKMFEGMGHNVHLELGNVFVEAARDFMKSAEAAAI